MPGDISINRMSWRKAEVHAHNAFRMAEPDAISVMDSVDVFDAKIASLAHTASSRCSKSRLTLGSRKTASITRSHAPNTPMSVVRPHRRHDSTTFSFLASRGRPTYQERLRLLSCGGQGLVGNVVGIVRKPHVRHQSNACPIVPPAPQTPTVESFRSF